MNIMPYGFRIVGDCSERRNAVDHAAAFAGYAACDARAEVDKEAYLSAFTFGQDFRELLTRTGSTKGFAGVCFALWIWFDIDRADDLPRAQADAGRLATWLIDRYGIAADALLLFFSGSKGFHAGLPLTFWTPPPGPDFHRIARRFCETVAAAAGVEIDVGVYDKVRAFRAPNSRHPKTGLHKRRVSLADVLHLATAEILTLAKEPAPFEVPSPTADDGHGDRLAADWQAAAEAIEAEGQARAARLAANNGAATLNRATMDFICNGPPPGPNRHRLLFSAAANLAEFGCPAGLAHALLAEAGLDSGLSPAEVRRQIDCGLDYQGAK